VACSRSTGVVGACCRKDGSGCTEPGGISSPTCCSSDWGADELDAALSANQRVGGSGCRSGVSCRGVGGAPKR
jgi:hypothetical protein